MFVAKISNIPIAQRFPLVVLVLAVLTAISISTISVIQIRKTMEQEALRKLHAMTTVIAHDFELVADNFATDLRTMASNYAVIEAMDQFRQGYTLIGLENENPRAVLQSMFNEATGDLAEDASFLDSSVVYRDVHTRWFGWFKNYADSRLYEDVLLIDLDGNVVFSVYKNDDIGIQVKASDALIKPLHDVFTKAVTMGPDDGLAFSDFVLYPIDGDVATSFIGRKVVNEYGNEIGILVFRLPSARFISSMSQETGLGEGVMSVLLGEDHLPKLSSGQGQAAMIEHADGLTRLEGDQGLETIHSMENPLDRALNGSEEFRISYHRTGEKFLEAFGPVELFGSKYVVTWDVPYAYIEETAIDLVRQLMITMVIAVAIFAVFVGISVRSITHPLNKMQEGLGRLAKERDLRVRVSTAAGDEIGQSSQAVDDILEIIEVFVRDTKQGADKLDALSKRMNTSAEGMAEGAEVLSSSIHQLSESMAMTEREVHEADRAAEKTLQIVERTADVAQQGQGKIAQMVDAMGGIEDSSKNISHIIKVIEDIAFQTNLLALNAAVEAARAGQEGKGFAVVAAEVRNLASKSSAAAQQTSKLIAEALQKVDAGVQVSGDTQKAFVEIFEDVRSAADGMRDIAETNNRQSRIVREVKVTADSMNEMAARYLRSSDELAQNAREVAMTSGSVNRQLSEFKFSDASGSKANSDANDMGAASTPVVQFSRHNPFGGKPADNDRWDGKLAGE